MVDSSVGVEMAEWIGEERRETQSDTLRRAVAEGMESVFEDEEKVKKITRAFLSAIQEELETGAGKYMFKGVTGALKRIGWILIIILLAFSLFGIPGIHSVLKALLE